MPKLMVEVKKFGDRKKNFLHPFCQGAMEKLINGDRIIPPWLPRNILTARS